MTKSYKVTGWFIQLLYAMLKEPTAQTAQLVPTWRDLVFAGTQANAEKNTSLSRIYFGKLLFANARQKNIEIEEWKMKLMQELK